MKWKLRPSVLNIFLQTISSKLKKNTITWIIQEALKNATKKNNPSIATYNDSGVLAYFVSENDSTYPKDSVATTTVASTTVPSCEYNMNTQKSRTYVKILLSNFFLERSNFCKNSIYSIHTVCDIISIYGNFLLYIYNQCICKNRKI